MSQNFTLSASTNNYTGYTIMLNTADGYTELAHNRIASALIPSISEDLVLANFPDLAWGYTTDVGANAIYHQIPASTDEIFATTGASEDEYDFGVGIRAVKEELSDGYYSNTLVFTVVANVLPVSRPITFSDITYMQSMTSEICASATVGDTARLKDKRDGKFYWITKLADNNCWMTQNLDLDLSTGVTLRSDTTDVESEWTPSVSTTSTGDWTWGNIPESYDVGDGYMAGGTNATMTSTSDLERYSDEWHYHRGNIYSWNAATAGSSVISSGTATESICPKGWQLPAGTGDKSWSNLITRQQITAANSVEDPIYITLGGSYYGSHDREGEIGFYWSASGTGDGTTILSVEGNAISGSASLTSNSGASIRCVAK